MRRCEWERKNENRKKSVITNDGTCNLTVHLPTEGPASKPSEYAAFFQDSIEA